MTKQDAVQWLGNRGHDIILSDIIRCKRLGKYLFILQKDYPEEVELYDAGDFYGECHDGFSVETFKWNKDYMRKLITGEI
tara:strand:- start:1751 stop:1990 length:240 start_codon:yes stop_codon:yes gene_type:complete